MGKSFLAVEVGVAGGLIEEGLGIFAAFGGRRRDTEHFFMSLGEAIADLLGMLWRSGTNPLGACFESGVDSDSLSDSLESSEMTWTDSDGTLDRLGTDSLVTLDGTVSDSLVTLDVSMAGSDSVIVRSSVL